MNDIKVIKRRLELKRQGVKLIKEEIRDLQIKLALHKIKRHLEANMSKSFDPVTSQKLDCLMFLLES